MKFLDTAVDRIAIRKNKAVCANEPQKFLADKHNQRIGELVRFIKERYPKKTVVFTIDLKDRGEVLREEVLLLEMDIEAKVFEVEDEEVRRAILAEMGKVA